ncbi:MAG: hypothetical protein HZB51_02865 [Chloroflexi bacterium]|nr:hypothetical protein [Chloroflexota bacterium]
MFTIGKGIVLGTIIGIAYGYLVLTSVMPDPRSSMVVGALMGIGFATIIMLTLQQRKKYQR